MDDKTPDTPVRRGPKPKPMPEKHKRAVAKALATGDKVAISKAMGAANHTPALYNRTITTAHIEAVLARVATGEVFIDICRDLGISAALVRQQAYDNKEFGDRLAKARAIAADETFDQELVVAWDMTISPADKKLILDTMARRSKFHNRAVYGDKVQIDQRQVVITFNGDDLDET